MSQKVDLSTPLTQEEYNYLQTRSQNDIIDRAHSMHGTSDADYAQNDGDWTGPQPVPATQGERAANRRAELLAELAALGEDDDTDDDVEGSDDGGSDAEDETAEPYENWPDADLNAELKNRGLSAAGKHDDKVKRLYADDETAK